MFRWKFTLNPDTDNKEITEPIGWETIPITLKRDAKWHGVFFEHSMDLTFFDDPEYPDRDAYTFMRDIYEEAGIEGFVILKVEMACNDTDDFTEEAQWRLCFDTYDETRGDLNTVTMSIEPSNNLMLFKNRSDQPVTFTENTSYNGSALTDYDYLNFSLTIPPKTVLQQANLESPGFVGESGNSHPDVTVNQTVASGGGTISHEAIGYFQFGLEPYDLDEIDTRKVTSDGSATTDGAMEANYEIEVAGTYTFDINVQGRLSVTVNTNANNTDCSGDQDTFNHIEYQVYLQAGATITNIFSETDDGCFNPTREFTSIPMGAAGIGLTYDLLAGDEVKLYVRIKGSGEWNQDALVSHDLDWTLQFDGEASMDIVAYTKSTASTAQVSLINEVGSRILEKITNDGLRMLSNYYGRPDSEPYPSPSGSNGPGALRALTSGLDIRQYTSGRLSLSFDKLFDNLNSIDNIGIGLEPDTERTGMEVIRMEDSRYFYEDTVILQLPDVPTTKITVANDMHYSTIKLGYAKWEAEEYLGLDEYATQREYRTELTSTKNPLDRVCEFIASGYAIEITRRQKLYNATTAVDWRYDNDTFIICLNPKADGLYTVEQGNIEMAANIIDPETILNYRISPVRNALRWLSTTLNSYRKPTDPGSRVIFTDGKGNILAEGKMTGGELIEATTLAENSTIDINSLADPADGLPPVIPERWTFDYPLGLSNYNLLKANPKGIIQAKFGCEVTYRDFFLSQVEYLPNEGSAKWTLMPKRLYPIDPCQIYIIQMRGEGTNQFGSAILYQAELKNLFVFVNGQLMKYNDSNTLLNEIATWDPDTGYGTLRFSIPAGRQITIFHLPPTDRDCLDCIHRYEGRGDGTTTPTITAYGVISLENTFVFYNGELMKQNDLNTANNEVTDYNTGTKKLTFAAATNANRELRVFGFADCDNIPIFNGHGDGTTTVALTGLGIGTLANIFVFYNGQLMKYNDANTANNELIAYTIIGAITTYNFTTNARRELRAFKLQNE